MFRLSLNRWIMDLWRKLLEKQNCIKNKMKLEVPLKDYALEKYGNFDEH